MQTIPLFKVFMSSSAETNVVETLRSGYIGEGPKAKYFEEMFSSAVNRQTRLVNSATSAIDLALHMIGLKEGDEVISTPITCTATNSPIVNRGAMVVWADVDSDGLISPNSVANLITAKTRAIIGVNWGGKMPQYEALKAFGIPVIEDAAHGPFFTTRERGDFIAWSFQAIKFLTTGDGGALYSPDPNRARLLRWYGLDRESSADFRCAQNIKEVGYKYHMNDIAASIGIANLAHLEWIVAEHVTNAQLYHWEMNNPRILLPTDSSEHPYWLFTLRLENRDKFIEYLTKQGISSSLVHARNDKHSAFRRASRSGSLLGVDTFDATQVSIPVGWWLTKDQKKAIINAINLWKG